VPKLTYTVTEAAELLGISRTTAYACVKRGEIPSVTLGRRILISRTQLEQLLASLPTTPINADPAEPTSTSSTTAAPPSLPGSST
jgi:excisionase family DNA binding protein